ncbi:hypothetical protein C8J56DRAFT_773606 [Mycena floridula]|nr:hypothetical protein C8J56DRAFT_773606 [Mycena floridula]
MTSVSILSANLAAVAVESLLYGAFVILAVISISLSLYRHSLYLSIRPGQCRWKLSTLVTPMFLGAIGLVVTITGHWIITVLRMFDAFVTYNHGETPTAYYADISKTTEVVKTGLLMATLVLSDIMIVYRMWIVWHHNRYVMIFPVLSILGLTVCGIGVTYQFYKYDPTASIFESEAGRWIRSDCVLTLATNLYSTGMIVWRLWSTDRKIKSIRSSGTSIVQRALVLIIESAAIYTTWTIIYIIAYELHAEVEATFDNAWPAVAGISFMLIKVRVGLGWAQETQNTNQEPASQHLDGNRYRMDQLTLNRTRERDNASASDFGREVLNWNGSSESAKEILV